MAKINAKEFGKKLRYMMDENELSKSDLAKKLGVTRSAINNYLRGANGPSTGNMIEICKILGADLEEMVGRRSEDE